MQSFPLGGRCVQGSFLLTVLWGTSAIAQMAAVPGTSSGVALPSIAAPGEGAASTDTTPRRAWSVQPRLNVTETITDNAVVSAGPRQSNQITQLSPGVRIEANTGRLRGFADYTLTNFIYAKGSQGNSTSNTLSSNATLEAIDRWLYLEASGTIAQQNISAFGAQTAGTGTISSNTTETSSFRLSPYVRGVLGRIASYEARYTHTETSSKSALASGMVSDIFSVRLTGNSNPLGFGWTADATRQEVTYDGSRKSQADQMRGTLLYRFDPQWQARVSIGAEANNYASAQRESRTTFGYGGDWTPTERTKLSVFRERRFFGNGHSITFDHRFPLSVIRFSDSRDVSVMPNQFANTSQGTYYDLLYAQLANSIPDPVARAQQVNTQLQQSGISPTASITNGFVTSRATVRRRQELSLVLNGLRNTVTYTLFQSDQQSISTQANIADDFSTSNSVKQRGMSSNFSHRLSPLSSLNALSSWTRSDGSAGVSSSSRVFSLNASTRFSGNTSATIGLRRTRTEGANSYNENAMIASLTARF